MATTIQKLLNLLCGCTSVLLTWKNIKFKYSFEDSLYLYRMWHCNHDLESTSHFLLFYVIFANERHFFWITLNGIGQKLLENTDGYAENYWYFKKRIKNHILWKKSFSDLQVFPLSLKIQFKIEFWLQFCWWSIGF